MSESCRPGNRAARRINDELIDKEVYDAAFRYARRHNVNLCDLIECALVTYMGNEYEPVELKFCDTHRVAMECNSSGTVSNVCPVAEGLGGGFNPEEVK